MNDDDPRRLAAMKYAWNTSNWPERLQRHILGQPVPYDFVLGLLAAVDAVDPLRQGQVPVGQVEA